MKKKKESEKDLLANSDKKPHGNAKEFDWKVFDALLVSDPTKVYCCDYLGVSDTHIDNKIKEKFGMTFTEYKSLRLQDTVVRIKAAMIREAESGDVPAGKYVLSNISDWTDKKEVAVEDVSDRELLEAVSGIIIKGQKG